ncbi:MAG TPA: hypothetical protein VJU87_03275 [Gemmatimonadaceae bacterium]|nr:hypothetical protein [Gemmatimonadaceae bacterium]
MESNEPTITFAMHWARGDRVPGVTFSPATHVRILGGPFTDECGHVRALVSVDPEPCYRVEVDAARVSLQVAQSSLENL